MNELHKAFIAAQAEMPSVAADATNPHFRSQFVSLDHLIAETRPILNKHGLAVIQEPVIVESGAPALQTTLIHTSGESRDAVMPLILAGQDMQKLGAAITYARRYAWAALLGIGEPDDDGETASGRPVKRAAPKIGPNVLLHNPATPPTPDDAEPLARPKVQQPEPAAIGGGGLSLLDMAREAARHGNRFYYGAFWDMRSVAEKKEIAKIRDELNALMKEADEALAD